MSDSPGILEQRGPGEVAAAKRQLVRGLGLWDSTMLVAGSMIGSGIFIVSADMARLVGASGWLLAAWLATGLLTISAALSYGELAAMMPRAGGQYVYLREAFGPLWGFLYGWTFFLVIQTGVIAAVAVAFSRFVGVLVPAVSATNWLIPPIHLPAGYAVSLSTQQLVAIGVVVLLTVLNARGLRLGKTIQNFFTPLKVLSLLALIVIGVLFGRNAEVIQLNFSNLWTPHEAEPVAPGSAVLATSGAFGLLVAFCVAQVGSLFASDSWNNITFTAGEVKNPKRDLPLALAAGTALVTVLYLCVNLAYLFLLPLSQIQAAPDDRVATAAIETVFHGAGAAVMAIAIMVSTFGCLNGNVLSGPRVYYAMAQDGLFFRATGRLNRWRVPGVALVLQCVWTCLLVLPRTVSRDAATGAEKYGNLYSDLLSYIEFAMLLFYALTMAGLFVLRRKRPEAERPYRAFGYPVLPVFYILGASAIMLALLFYRTQTTWPGVMLVLLGVPAYFASKRRIATAV